MREGLTKSVALVVAGSVADGVPFVMALGVTYWLIHFRLLTYPFEVA